MKRIKKCDICGEPYWETSEKREGSNEACPDCIAKADNKEYREMNKPRQFK